MATKLNPKQELFCKTYVSEGEFFGNGVQSYIESHKPDQSKPNWYNTAKSVVSVMLTNDNLLKRIDELLDADGFNDQFADKQIKFLMTQNADFSNKLGAIREYNKLKARIQDKIEHTGEVSITVIRE